MTDVENEKEISEENGLEELPSNSKMVRHEDREPIYNATPRRVPEKVVTTNIKKRKKSFLDKLSESFFGDDTKSVGQYVLWDVLIPAAKNTISDMVSTGIEMLLFGRSKSDSIRRDKGKSYVSYSSFYKGRDRDDRRESMHSRGRYRFDDIIIENKREAEEVLFNLVEQIDNYDVATVADFYDMVGMDTDFTSNKYGWTNLSRAYVERVRDGYILVMPKPQELD